MGVQPPIGSAKWLDNVRTRVLLSHRAVDDFSQACRSIHRLTEFGPAPGDPIGTSLLQYAIVSYCKPFNSAGRPVYSVKKLKLEKDFNLALHRQVLAVRNTAIAHADAEYAAAYIGYRDTSTNDTDGCVVAAELWAFDGLDPTSPAASTLLRHMNAAYIFASRELVEQLTLFGKGALAFPDARAGLELGTWSSETIKLDGIDEHDMRTRQVTSAEVIVRGSTPPSA